MQYERRRLTAAVGDEHPACALPHTAAWLRTGLQKVRMLTLWRRRLLFTIQYLYFCLQSSSHIAQMLLSSGCGLLSLQCSAHS